MARRLRFGCADSEDRGEAGRFMIGNRIRAGRRSKLLLLYVIFTVAVSPAAAYAAYVVPCPSVGIR